MNMNEYIANEVRNPLFAAISACDSLSIAHQEECTLHGPEESIKNKSMHEHINIVSSSLDFIYDLIRSMLDNHKPSDNQLTLVNTPTGILKDDYIHDTPPLDSDSAGMSIYGEASDHDVSPHCDDRNQ
jgi:hypothetical protein